MAKIVVHQEGTVEYAPILMPTYEQWRSFAAYLTHHEASLQRRSGAAKILPPTRWTPLLKNPYEIRHIKTYLKQEVIRSSHQSNVFYIKKSEVNKRRLVSFDEFKSLAESDAHRLKDDITTNLIDHFWATVTTTTPVAAKDIDGSLFDKRESVFNMVRLPSLLKYYPRTISGVTYPSLHLGMWASAVGLHIDDHDLTALYYHHTGATRLWFIVHPSSYAKLEELVNELKLFSELPLSCLSPLQHKSLLLDPSFLRHHLIQFSVIEQKMNELVVIFPGVYHFYFDTGFNLIESVRYAFPSWLTFQRMSPRLCSCTVPSPTGTLNRRFFTNEILRRFEEEHLSSAPLFPEEEQPETSPSAQIETTSVAVQTDAPAVDLSNDIACNWFCSIDNSTPADQNSSNIDELWSSLESIPTPIDADPPPERCANDLSSSLSPTHVAPTFAEIYQDLLDSQSNKLLNWRRLKKRKCYHCRQKGHLNRHCPFALAK